MTDATVRLQALDGTWEVCGVDRLRGITPEGIQLSSTEWGSDRASFTLRRDPGGIYPDLSAFTPVDVEIGGQLVWSGRISETPTRDGQDSSISVECEGWHYHLDDDVYGKSYVRTKLADWQDERDFLAANLAVRPTGWEINTGGGVILLSVPSNATVPNATGAGVLLDTGDGSGVKRVVITYTGGGKAGLDFYVQSGTPGTWPESNLMDATPIATTSTTAAFTFTTARRYVEVLLWNGSGATMTGDANSWLRIEAAQVFRSTTYESGNASVITADVIARDARDSATDLLSLSDERVFACTFPIPEFAIDDYRTPREVMQAVNAYEDRQIGVDVYKRLVMRARPTAPLYEVGNWTGAELEDAAANSGDELYNWAILQGTGADGQKLVTTRQQTAATLMSRRGFARTKVLQVQAAGTTASYNQIGDLFLAGHKTTPMRGNLKATGPTAVRKVLGGETVHPAKLLTQTGELVRLSHRIDPDTGGQGRDARMTSVTYTHNGETAQVELDNRRGNFEALLERLAIVTGQF